MFYLITFDLGFETVFETLFEIISSGFSSISLHIETRRERKFKRRVSTQKVAMENKIIRSTSAISLKPVELFEC